MANFNDRYSEYPFPQSRLANSNMTNTKAYESLKGAMDAKAYEMNNLIHDSFPSQGTEQPAHLGSQSNIPNKE